MALEMFKDVRDNGVSPDSSLVVLCWLSSPPLLSPLRPCPSIPFLNWLEPECRQSQAEDRFPGDQSYEYALLLIGFK